MHPRRLFSSLLVVGLCLGCLLGPASRPARANPWNGKVVLQAFWWDCWNARYPPDRGGWYTYLAKLCPRLRAMGFDGIWIPAPSKSNSGVSSMGYDPFDHYDLGNKNQKGTVPTRFGDQDALLRLIAVAHANGLEVYLDVVLNHCVGGEIDPDAPANMDNRYKRFRYAAFGGQDTGRWPKSWLDFHPNPKHEGSSGDWTDPLFGADICYRDPCVDPGKSDPVRYMRDQARAWLVWLRAQTDADGFRFDAVKHFPAEVIEDLLFNVFGPRRDYFAVGEYVGNADQMDGWAHATLDRSGTFDFAFRTALADIIQQGGFFDMGSLPNFQQHDRLKTVLFVNNHDTWRGAFWDSGANNSTAHDDRSGDFRQIEGTELAPTIDPDNPRAGIAYAAAFSVDGNVMVYYEDLFVNSGAERNNADPQTYPTRGYVENLVRAHRRLNFKDGAYKVRFQGSPDLLVIERSRRALIGLNDSGTEAQTARVQTDFGPRVRLRDGAGGPDLVTDASGQVSVTVPPMGFRVWGPASITGNGTPNPPRRTVQQFEFADDLGDARPETPGYGGRLVADAFRTAGAIYAAAGSTIRLTLSPDAGRDVELRVDGPDAAGKKSRSQRRNTALGLASANAPLRLEFRAGREGFYLLQARLRQSAAPPTHARLAVDYVAPAASGKF